MHNRFVHRVTRRRVITMLALCVFTALAGVIVYFAQAAVSTAKSEAESGSIANGASVISSGSASGQQAVKFAAGNAGCDLTPGPLRSDKQFVGSTTGVAVNYSISLPADYYSSCKEYPVMYSLHGKDDSSSGFMNTALIMRDAVAAGVLSDVIIITPDSYVNGRWENGANGPAEDNFIIELIPYVESHYRVKKGASYRLLTGFSMGGHGAFRFAVKFPTMFAATLVVDGAMSYTPSDYTQYIDGVRAHNPPIYTIGGQLCGSRVQTIVNAFGSQGVTFPYVYYDLSHDYTLFINQDKNMGWPGVKFLQSRLGRTVL